MKKQLQTFYTALDEIYQLRCIDQLLGWDQQVYMPELGEKPRTKQLELVSKLIHERYTNKQFLNTVDSLFEESSQLKHNDNINVREVKRQVDQERKLPLEFVGRKTKAHSEAYSTWIKARENNNFKEVLPQLSKNIKIAKEEAELRGYEESRYDALLDTFEPQSKLSIIKPALLTLGDGLKKILPQILESSQKKEFQYHPLSVQEQEKVNSRVIKDLGYSEEFGRLDIAPHPFMTSFGPRDLRVTTRYEESNYLSSLLTALHEVGHALYEYGFPEEFCGTPRGEAASLSIHESQSRFWENIIGRSKAFSTYLYNVLQEVQPSLAKETSEAEIWNTLNAIKPSLIRVEADEVTYSIHVIIRLLLEADLINNDLNPKDLPEAWNSLYKEYLDIDVPNDRDGVLQDVHWFHVGFGYFPTYALGNLYGALMLDKMTDEGIAIDSLVANGNFSPILEWTRENIHTHGMTYSGPEIAQRLSGKELSSDSFLKYISSKHSSPS